MTIDNGQMNIIIFVRITILQMHISMYLRKENKKYILSNHYICPHVFKYIQIPKYFSFTPESLEYEFIQKI